MSKPARNRAVFVDRDGTINVDVHYLSKVRDLKFYPGVKDGLRALNNAGFKIIIITNQSGIARGLFTEKKLAQIHNRLVREIIAAGGRVDGIYYCPHHPDDGCRCRKPGTLMFEKAVKEHRVDAKKSFVIGDTMLDVGAGHRIGCRTVLVPEEGHEKDVMKKMKKSRIKPDYIAGNFSDGVGWVLGYSH